jgi:hypothetical protein
MTRKRKPFYPQARPSRKGPPPPGSDASVERPNLATINLSAGAGQAGLRVGDRVRIDAAGTYSGETAVIERLSSGAIPSAVVRTDSGGTRQVRTIDLAPIPREPAKAERDEGADA